MDQGETSARGALILFVGICALIFAGWVFIGPGGIWVASIIAQGKLGLRIAAEWYQGAIEGPSKLIAPAITILSGSYAIYKAYAYAESRLHYRLGDYIKREERRLADAREKLRLIVERPSVERRFREPIFLEQPLKRVVRELRWGSYLLGPQLGYVRSQLDTSIARLTHQVELAKGNHRHMVHQLATAHMLRGAMDVSDAAKAKARSDDDRLAINSALHHFESALAVHEQDCEALEYAAHMHVCLRQDGKAEKYLDRLLDVTSADAKSLSRARGYRYKSEIEFNRNFRTRARSAAKAALKVLPNIYGEDRIEEAEMQEIVGDRQIALHAHVQARSHWEIARALFGQLKSREAEEGRRRVAEKLAALDRLPDKDSDGDDDED